MGAYTQLSIWTRRWQCMHKWKIRCKQNLEKGYSCFNISRFSKILVRRFLNVFNQLFDFKDTRSSQPLERKKLCQRIKSSFSKIEGFLLPYPGNVVARHEGFHGQIKGLFYFFVCLYMCLLKIFPKLYLTM